jgi:hypothetical protein
MTFSGCLLNLFDGNKCLGNDFDVDERMRFGGSKLIDNIALIHQSQHHHFYRFPPLWLYSRAQFKI